MTDFSHEGTEALQKLADEVERERLEKARRSKTDDDGAGLDRSEDSESDDGETREDHEAHHGALSGHTDEVRIGAMSRNAYPKAPGI